MKGEPVTGDMDTVDWLSRDQLREFQAITYELCASIMLIGAMGTPNVGFALDPWERFGIQQLISNGKLAYEKFKPGR